MPAQYREVWCVDFEFYAPAGERPTPVCVVGRELNSGRLVRLFGEQLHRSTPPYDISPDALFVAYYASAELGCHLALNWKMPANVIDLYAEFRNYTNGSYTAHGRSLLGALTYFGLDGIGAEEKTGMRNLVMRGFPYTDEEAVALLDYCQSDVDATARLWEKMVDKIALPYALLRGRYEAAVARMEWAGVPIDTVQLERLRSNWKEVQSRLIQATNNGFGIYEGTTFKLSRFAEWLEREGILWSYTEKGKLSTEDKTFKDMEKIYPKVASIRQLREALSQLRLSSISVGSDGRNRSLVSPFGSKTGRNTPSNSKTIFGASSWLRSLIKPPEGKCIAYIDWSQQEFGIGAVLAGDKAMIKAYASGDPYLEFGKQAGVIPPNGTKATYAAERAQFKVCALGVQFGMGHHLLADQLKDSLAKAKQLLQLHRETYRDFWRMVEAAKDQAFLGGDLSTVFRWNIRCDQDAKALTFGNYPMQANGAEMLRLAAIAATEQGVEVCAPVHDALLIEAPVEELAASIWTTQQAMRDASAAVLDGFELRSEVEVFRYPKRYVDERGEEMWNTVMEILDDIKTGETAELLEG